MRYPPPKKASKRAMRPSAPIESGPMGIPPLGAHQSDCP